MLRFLAQPRLDPDRQQEPEYCPFPLFLLLRLHRLPLPNFRHRQYHHWQQLLFHPVLYSLLPRRGLLRKPRLYPPHQWRQLLMHQFPQPFLSDGCNLQPRHRQSRTMWSRLLHRHLRSRHRHQRLLQDKITFLRLVYKFLRK
ncbi:MAG: hypothetical protein ACK559_15950 [bacterium]